MFGAIIGLVAASFGPAWKVFANAPADTSTYAGLTINNHTTLNNVNDATSVVAGYEHGSMTISGMGLYSDGVNQVYAPNSSNVTINIAADQNYTGDIWINGVNTHDTIANLNNVSSNDIFNIDAVFAPEEGQGNTQATFDYTYAGTDVVDWTINGSFIDVRAQQFDNNHANFTGTYDTQPGDTTVNFEFTTLWINVMDGLTINGTDYSDLLPVGSAELAAAYNGSQMIAVQVPNVPIASTYVITSSTHEITEQEQFMGNFLWDNDTSKLDDPTIPEEAKDDIIGHGTLEFVKAEYDNVTYNSVEELNAAGNLFYFENNNNEMSTDGVMTMPIGAKVTLRLLPEAGYQLVSFGINGGQFEPQENVGEYTFVIRPGNGHLAANFAKVANEVEASDSEAVESGTISLRGGEIDSGTARLDVKDVDLTDEEVAGFENAAGEYNVSTFLDISLYQTTYKGTPNESWDEQINQLRHAATITLQLGEDVDGNDIVIVHQKHDGTYEVIPTIYDPINHTITFKTSSFSNYAIATRTVANAATANSPETGAFTSNGGNAAAVSIFGGILVVLTIGGIVLKRHDKKK